MSDMNLAIAEAIKANLPEAVAGEMKRYLDEAKAAMSDNVRLNKALADARARIAQLEEYSSKMSRENEILKDADIKTQALAKELQNKEIGHIKLLARNEADIANAAKSAAFEVIGLFLRNPSIRTDIQRTVTHPVEGVPPSQYNSSGSCGFVGSGFETESKTVTNE